MLFKVYSDLLYNEIIGTVDELSVNYNVNPYQMYKIIMTLKNSEVAKVFIKNDLLKLIKFKADLESIELEDYSRKIQELKNLFNNFKWEV
ncbi:hypothetical protein PL321_13590 [Caloramator sp. mosi_1]|uniref:hypothetical protein n=1 Tax=Caloramator sp. mosi_1 TaxID=3023090 RepID=UPI002360EF03|nr:hypothetical protein [Caloramator sp. mosi_1]WDC83635.1 hypothetical protein PL321_13590 [Caloramator sp. mosi_1]